MYEVSINGQEAVSVEFKGEEVWIEDKPSEMDIVRTGAHSFQVIHKGGSYSVHILDLNPEEKTVVLRINGKKAELVISSELDRLLKRMGLEKAAVSKVNKVIAPMPGLIHSIEIEIGAEVDKGDTLLILEAMKMENVIKSPAKGRVAKIHIKEGTSVDKGQIMVSFE